MFDVDVVVVGGGPAGMTVAGDLARAGRSVTVLERWPQVNPASRAFVTMPRTLEALDGRGLADGLLARGHRTPEVRLFAGASLDLTRVPSPYPFGLIAPQTEVDRALAGYAEREGATVLRGTEVVGLEQDDDGVTLTARPKGGGDPRTWRARYAVGADGAHSTVRSLLGVAFPGKAVLSSVVLADVRLTDGPAGDGLTLGSTPDAFGFLVPYGEGGRFRSMTWDRTHQLPDDAPVDDGEVRDVLRRAMGRDVGVAAITWRSRFHCDERQVPDYRLGRVFLAGDAAHVHSPMGGQGMNTGIQDGANLGWKLAAVLGGADEAILDTYHAERHPIGRRVLRQSGTMLRAVTAGPRAARLARDLLAPLVLRVPAVSAAIAGSFSGTTLRYGRTRGDHRLVGTSATPVPLAGPSLATLQRSGGFVLVRERDAAPADASLPEAQRADAGPALLVRPDGYVAWAGSSASGRPWRAALARWS